MEMNRDLAVSDEPFQDEAAKQGMGSDLLRLMETVKVSTYRTQETKEISPNANVIISC